MTRFTSRALTLAAVCAVASPRAPRRRARRGNLDRQRHTAHDAGPDRADAHAHRGRGPERHLQVVIFDGAKQVLYMVNPAREDLQRDDQGRRGRRRRAARRRDGADAEGARRHAAGAARADGSHDEGPPGHAGHGRGRRSTEYRRGGTSKVSKWTCDVYEGFQNNAKTGEVCTVSAERARLRRRPTSRCRGSSPSSCAGSIPQGADQVFAAGAPRAGAGIQGVPVRRVATVAGREIVTELTSVARQTFPDSSFAVPDGFTQQTSAAVRIGPRPRHGSKAPAVSAGKAGGAGRAGGPARLRRPFSFTGHPTIGEPRRVYRLCDGRRAGAARAGGGRRRLRPARRSSSGCGLSRRAGRAARPRRRPKRRRRTRWCGPGSGSARSGATRRSAPGC